MATLTKPAPGQAKAEQASAPPKEVKNALDESRTLVLGVQVLLGFQYAALFQPAFSKLPIEARQLDPVAMGLMLVSLILLLAVIPFHILGAGGEDSRPVINMARRRIEQALVPFALALGVDVAMVMMRLDSAPLAIGLGVVATVVALLFWYGGFWLRPSGAPGPGKKARSKEMVIPADQPAKPTPLDQKIEQMLTETRVVLPGVQALLGFQFTGVLSDSFTEMPTALRILHVACLGLLALAMVLLMAAPAYHRMVAGGDNRPDVHKFGATMVLAAMVPVALGLAGDFYIVLARTEVSQALALALTGLVLALCVLLWLAYPLLARRKAAARA